MRLRSFINCHKSFILHLVSLKFVHQTFQNFMPYTYVEYLHFIIIESSSKEKKNY